VTIIKELNKPIIDFEGKEFEVEGKPITLKRAVMRAADYGINPKGGDIDPETKYRQFNIGQDFSRADDEITVSKNDMETLFEMIKFYIGGIYSRCRAHLEKYKDMDKKEK